jgi:hypothetical protein
MNNYELYSKFKINYDDYQHYNTYFIKNGRDKVYKISDRLKFIENMLNNEHQSLSDDSILKIIKHVKKDLIFSRRFYLFFGACCIVAFYFAIQYMQPTVGISLYYQVPVVGNNPWDFLLVVIILLIAWYYEKINHKKNLTSKTKDYIIASVEEHYAEIDTIQKVKEARKQHNKNLNRKRKKRK